MDPNPTYRSTENKVELNSVPSPRNYDIKQEKVQDQQMQYQTLVPNSVPEEEEQKFFSIRDAY